MKQLLTTLIAVLYTLFIVMPVNAQADSAIENMGKQQLQEIPGLQKKIEKITTIEIGEENKSDNGKSNSGQEKKSENSSDFKNNIDNITDNLNDLSTEENTQDEKDETEVQTLKQLIDEIEKEAEEITTAIAEVETRNKWKTLLVGSDYTNLGKLRSSLVKNRNQIRKLDMTIEKTESEEEKQILQEQVALLTQERERIMSVIEANESQFSILGWVFKRTSGYNDEDIVDSIPATESALSEETETSDKSETYEKKNIFDLRI